MYENIEADMMFINRKLLQVFIFDFNDVFITQIVCRGAQISYAKTAEQIMLEGPG